MSDLVNRKQNPTVRVKEYADALQSIAKEVLSTTPLDAVDEHLKSSLIRGLQNAEWKAAAIKKIHKTEANKEHMNFSQLVIYLQGKEKAQLSLELNEVNQTTDFSSDQNHKYNENQGSYKKRHHTGKSPFQKSYNNNSPQQQGQNRNFNNSYRNQTQGYAPQQQGQSPSNNTQQQNEGADTPHHQTTNNPSSPQGQARNFYQQPSAQGQNNQQTNNVQQTIQSPGQQATAQFRQSPQYVPKQRPMNDNQQTSPQQNGVYQVNNLKDQKPDVNLKGVAILNNTLVEYFCDAGAVRTLISINKK